MSRFRPILIVSAWSWVLAIWVLSLTPPVDTGIHTVSHLDKLGHWLAYFIAMLWFGFLYPRQRVWSVMGLLLMGLSLELLQSLTSTRHMDGFDMLANTLGVLIGWFIAVLYVNPRFKN